MKRVLLINTAVTTLNGITSVIMNYVRKTYHIVDYDFLLCGRADEKFIDELSKLGKHVYRPPCSRSKKSLDYSSWLKKLIRQNRYDVIHVHGNSGTVYFEIHAAKKAGVPVRIAHSHSTSCKHQFVHRILKPLINHELTHAIACSDLAGKWLFTKDYTVLQNGIDVDKFAFSNVVREQCRRDMGLADKFVIGHIGYMDTEKNHLYLLRVFKKLIEKRPDARLLLIGDGRLRSEIESFIDENELRDFVYVLGKRSDVEKLYQCMDVFVLPSLFEGLPVTLVEAQSAGLPCVVSDTVTKQISLTQTMQYVGIEDTDIDAWISCILRFADTENDRSAYADVMKASDFNIENCTEKLMRIYENGKS